MSLFVYSEKYKSIYHGSRKLFNINCYIKKHRNSIDIYLERLRKGEYQSSLVDIDSKIIEKVKDVLKESSIKMRNRYQHTGSWTPQIILIYLLNFIKDRHVYQISELIRVTLDHLLKSEESEFYNIYEKDFREIVTYIRKIENSKPEERDRFLKVDFYTVMRQPVQFFGPRDVALDYAENNDKYLYAYDPVPNLKLLNLSSSETFETLCSSKEMPFWDYSPFSEKLSIYYTESPSLTMTSQIIVDNYRELYKETNIKLQELQQSYQKLKDADMKINFKLIKLSLYLAVEKSTTTTKVHFVDVPTLLGEELENAILLQVQQLYLEHREIWLRLAKMADLDLENLDLETIQARCCDQFRKLIPVPLTKWNSFQLKDVIDTIKNSKFYESEMELRTIEAKECFAPYLADIDKHLGFVPEVKQRVDDLRKMIEADDFRIDTNTSNSDLLWLTEEKIFSFLKELSLSSSEWLIVNICSPRGCWYSIHWNHLVSTDRSVYRSQRRSWYSADTLLAYQLTTSKWFSDQKLAGWYCNDPEEFMIFNPEIHGTIRKIDESYIDSEDCDYQLEEAL